MNVCSSKQSSHNCLGKCFFSIFRANAFLSSRTPVSAVFIHGEYRLVCLIWQLAWQHFFLKSPRVCSLAPSMTITLGTPSRANSMETTWCASYLAFSGKARYHPNLVANICAYLFPRFDITVLASRVSVYISHRSLQYRS